MAWYWWVVIGAVLVVGGYVKVRVLTAMIRRSKKGADEDV
jgi:hypothetical protein